MSSVARDQLSLAIRSPFSQAPAPRRDPGTNKTGMLGKDRLQLSSAALGRLSGTPARSRPVPPTPTGSTFFGEA